MSFGITIDMTSKTEMEYKSKRLSIYNQKVNQNKNQNHKQKEYRYKTKITTKIKV